MKGFWHLSTLCGCSFTMHASGAGGRARERFSSFQLCPFNSHGRYNGGEKEAVASLYSQRQSFL